MFVCVHLLWYANIVFCYVQSTIQQLLDQFIEKTHLSPQEVQSFELFYHADAENNTPPLSPPLSSTSPRPARRTVSGGAKEKDKDKNKDKSSKEPLQYDFSHMTLMPRDRSLASFKLKNLVLPLQLLQQWKTLSYDTFLLQDRLVFLASSGLVTPASPQPSSRSPSPSLSTTSLPVFPSSPPLRLSRPLSQQFSRPVSMSDVLDKAKDFKPTSELVLLLLLLLGLYFM
jgi:hypothetical protein